MKNILSIGISGKKIVNKKLFNPIKFDFCFGSKAAYSNMENEIMKSFTNISKSFNLNSTKKPCQEIPEEDKTVTLSILKDKYYNKQSENEIDEIIKVIFREEVVNIKQEKEYENLILFIKNCKKYSYPEYLTDVKFFKNKEIKNFMTNTSLLETLHQKESPFGLEKEFQMKFKVQQLYKLRRGENGEKLDRLTEKEFEMEKYNYMNYLAETSIIDKINKFKNINEKNNKIMEEYKSNDKLLETEENVEIEKEAWKNHYIQYLKKLKKSERQESLGASRYEEPYFNEAIKQNVEEIFQETNSYSQNAGNEGKDNEEENPTFAEGRRYNQNDAKAFNDGTNEPYPYHDSDDYPIEEYFDVDRTAPGANAIIYGPLREIGKYEPLPPHIDNYFDKFFIDTHMWGLFASNLNFNVDFKQYNLGMKNVLLEIMNRNKALNGQKFSIGDSFNIDLPQSLIHYYNLLPKWARDHPSIKMLVRGLEYYQPWISYREKINLVNLGLKFVMDRDSKYLEIYEDIYQSHPENITLENLPSLMEHNDDLERNILQDPDDEATDDEEFEFFQSAEEVRALEKQEEEERKLKKKEEGRAKRAAEEAKQAAAEGKVDKAAEEKKKKEEAEKKKQESEAAGEEGEEAKEEEEEGGEEEGMGGEDESFKDEKMFSPRKKLRKIEEDKGDELVGIYDSLKDKMKIEYGEKEENEDLENENEDDLGQDNSGESNNIKNRKDEIEDFRKTFREQKAIIQDKKNKINDIINDLRTSENLRIFEENIQILKKNLEDNNIKFMKQREEEKFKSSMSDTILEKAGEPNKTDESAILRNDLIVFPLTLISSRRFNEDQKNIIKTTFSMFINDLNEQVRKEYTIELDENVSKKKIEEAEFEILNRISAYENDQTEKAEGIDVSVEYKDSLKDDDLQVDESEEIGLTDAYYKPLSPINHRFRTEDPIPFEFYINDDGFWDDYIGFQKSKIDVKQITIKPFIQIKDQIKKKEQLK